MAVNERSPAASRHGARERDGRCKPLVGIAEVDPQVGVVPVGAAVICQADQFVAVQCVNGLHASALLALAVVATCVVKHPLCRWGVRKFSEPT